MTDTTITINPTQVTELEFDLTTNGLHKDSDIPVVRLLLSDSISQVNYTIPCQKKNNKKWIVKIPELSIDTNNDHTFVIECIIDGYYFTPAEGLVNFVSSIPKASFVKEGAEAANITGQYAPTNGLLKPEREPKRSSAKTPKTEPMDDYIDLSKLAGDVTPGSGKQYVQSDNKQELEPRDIVSNIISRSKKGFKESNSQSNHGILFTRDSSGKIIVPGLETPEQQKEIKEYNKKIRNILKK